MAIRQFCLTFCVGAGLSLGGSATLGQGPGIVDGGGVNDGGGVLDRLPGSGVIDGVE